MKKYIIIFSIIFLLSVAAGYLFHAYQYRTIECWWGSIYPTLSFVGESNGTDNIEYKFAIVEWLKSVF